MGIPIEESVLQLALAGTATVTAVAITVRACFARMRDWRKVGASSGAR
jgi:hypothetical protein